MLPPEPTLFLAFANHFKVEAIVKDGLDREKVFGDKDDKTRRALQLRGTEEGRDVFGENIWLDMGLEWMYTYLTLGYTRYVFSDARFPNEIERVKELDGRQMTVLGQVYEFQVTVVRVIAPQRSLDRAQREADKNNTPVEKITGHFSETALDAYTGFDFVVPNDYADNPYPQLKSIARGIVARALPPVLSIVDVDDTLCVCGAYYASIMEYAESQFTPLAANQGYSQEQAKVVFEAEAKRIHEAHQTGVFRVEAFAEVLTESFGKACQAIGFDPDYAQAEQQRIYAAGLGVYDYPYEPLPGALEALRELQELGPVVLYSHGDRVEQLAKIARLGLSRLPVFISPNKGEDSLTLLIAQYPAKAHLMFGDSFRRDVQPALNRGCARVYWINNGAPGNSFYKALSSGVTEVTTLAEAVQHERALHQAPVLTATAHS
jgi:FMN phosphatase YigB (HAD superfamily)